MPFTKNVYRVTNKAWSFLRSFYKATIVIIKTTPVLIVLLTAASVKANETKKAKIDGSQQILASCQAMKVDQKSANSASCLSYIQGFLAGAWGVHNVKRDRVKSKNQKPTTWEERAYRYRVGEISPRYLPKNTNYYCLPAADSEARIIAQFNGLETEIKDISSLNKQIYKAITLVCPSDELKNIKKQ